MSFTKSFYHAKTTSSARVIHSMRLSAQEREIDTGSFTELSYGISGTLYLKQGSEDKVIVDAPDDVFDDIEIENRNGRLTIRNRRNSWVGKVADPISVCM